MQFDAAKKSHFYIPSWYECTRKLPTDI